MNKVLLCGRATKDPDVRYTQGDKSMAVAKFSLAVDRKRREDGADFINCVAFGKNGEFAEKYIKKGTKIIVEGSIQTGSYTNKDGQTVYTTEVNVAGFEFVESKGSNGGSNSMGSAQNSLPTGDLSGLPLPQGAQAGFMNIPEGIDEQLPFAKPSR